MEFQKLYRGWKLYCALGHIVFYQGKGGLKNDLKAMCDQGETGRISGVWNNYYVERIANFIYGYLEVNL